MLKRLLNAAEDRGELTNPASTHRRPQPRQRRRRTYTKGRFERSKAFVWAEREEATLTDFITNRHPLSTMQVNLGKATLRR